MIIYRGETTNFQDGGKENSIEKTKSKPRGGCSCLNCLLVLLKGQALYTEAKKPVVTSDSNCV